MNFYQLLGVSKNATIEEIKQAYRKLAIKYHPDKNPGNQKFTKRFKELTNAYNILKNKKKRREYDETINKQNFGNTEGTYYSSKADKFWDNVISSAPITLQIIFFFSGVLLIIGFIFKIILLTKIALPVFFAITLVMLIVYMVKKRL